MDFIRITCARPGMWRAGLQHPARATYPASQFDAAQLERLRADPAFTVEEAGELEEAEAPADTAVPLSAAELPTPRRIVASVIRLLMPDTTEPFRVELSEALLRALDEGLSGEDFRPIAEAIFARYRPEPEPQPAEPAGETGDLAPPTSPVDEGSEAPADGASDPAPATKPTRKTKPKA